MDEYVSGGPGLEVDPRCILALAKTKHHVSLRPVRNQLTAFVPVGRTSPGHFGPPPGRVDPKTATIASAALYDWHGNAGEVASVCWGGMQRGFGHWIGSTSVNRGSS